MTEFVPDILAPHPDPRKPGFEMPAKACDAHCHVFGPGALFPYAPNRSYTPPDASKADLKALHDHLGIERCVIVQASCHGTDNSAMVDAIRTSNGRYKGVGMVDDDVTDEELADLNAGGVLAARFNFVRHLGGPPDLDVFHSVIPRIAELGWHVVLHLDDRDIVDYEDMFAKLPLPIVIDHMGRVDPSQGLDAAPMQTLLKFMEYDNVWVKVSGSERISRTGSPYDDAAAIARALVEKAPDRVLWGTDWPHPNMKPGQVPDDGELVDIIPKFAVDEELRQKLLVDNPNRLYGFD